MLLEVQLPDVPSRHVRPITTKPAPAKPSAPTIAARNTAQQHIMVGEDNAFHDASSITVLPPATVLPHC
ncbi:hypothetical protein PanWU01x14_340690 [Parasponia andersonii]|uniref:Uncharacterized protein n=1 Tax=Parasponia andersonii TaxID=3476 RepID=A0A2P5AEC3_PARAD|nr:hypothetical protein PanWU01x14_340690 [Parasponia andersonii]